MSDQTYSIPPAGLPAAIGNVVPESMTSIEMAELVEKRHDNVKRTIDTLATGGVIQLPQIEEVTNHLGQRVEIYKVGERDSYVVVARLSPEFTARLVDFWQAHRKQPSLTPAEMFLQNAQAMVAIERRQIDQDTAIKAIGERVDEFAQAHVILDKMPSNCELITYIRKRINKQYGLSEKIVNKVMWETPYSPAVRVLVKNPHVDAEGAHNAGYAKKEVSAVFKRFVDECQMVTATMATHSFIEDRFKLVGKAGA